MWTLILTGLKWASKGVTGKLLGSVAKNWREAIIVLLVAALWLNKTVKDRTIDQLELELASANGIAASVTETQNRNEAALNSCLQANHANEQALKAMEWKAGAAQARAEALESRSAAEIEVINDEITQLRGQDVECRRLDDPLPEWFVDWLRE